jgi:hypothetical protein
MKKIYAFRMLLFLLSVIFVTTTGRSQTPNLSFAIGMRSSDYAHGDVVVADSSGNVYVCGGFLGTVDIDPGATVNNLVNQDPFSNEDLFVCKYSPTGSLVWGFPLGALYRTEIVGDMEIDSSGNIYITGSISFPIDFDPGPGTHILDPSVNGGNGFFLAKYDSTGNYVWAFTICSSNSVNSAFALAFDHSGNIVLTGLFGGNADFDPSANVAMVNAQNPFENTLVAKYTLNGQYLWAFMTGFYPGASAGDGIAIDPSNNIYIIGRTNDSTDLDPGPGAYYLPSGWYLGKYDPNGNFIWAYDIQSPGLQLNWTELATDQDGNIIVGGGFQGTVDFDLKGGVYNLNALNGFFDCFIVKYDSSANFIWAFRMGGSGNGIGEGVYDFHIDAANNIYAAGTFLGSMDADPGSGVTLLTAPTVNDFAGFVGRYSPSGTLDFAFTTGLYSKSVFETAAAFYITGQFYGTFDFDPGPGTFNLTSQSGDVYVAGYDFSTTGISEIPASHDSPVNIYPNPTRNYLVVESQGYLDAITIYDMKGKVVAEKTPGSRQTTLSLELAPGVYSVRARGENEVYQQKLVVY